MRSSGDPAYLVRIPVGDRAGLYRCHQLVYEACGRESRPLWRRCPGYVLALTASAPEGYASRPYDPSPQIGQSTRFDLLAEVSVAQRKEGDKRSRRYDPILEARFTDATKPYAQLALDFGEPWLRRQGARLGFEPINIDRCEYEAMDFVRQSKPMRIGAVRFAGRLRVTDPEGFRRALLDGVGHSKAWGCGLLLCFRP